MAAPARLLITDLPKGHEFDIGAIDVTLDVIERYLDAVADANAVYRESMLAPPLAVGASALGALLDVIELPGGTLHTGQEVDVHGGVPIGTRCSMSGRIAQRSERAGMVIMVIEFAVTPSGATAPALVGRTTVLAPGARS